MRLTIPLLFLIFPVTVNAFTQSPADTSKFRTMFLDTNIKVYQLDWKKEAATVVPATLCLYIKTTLEPRTLTIYDLPNLDMNDIPAFERDIIYFDSADAANASHASDQLNKATQVIGAISLFASYKNWNEIPVNFILFTEAGFLNAELVDLLKIAVGRIRPYAYNEQYSDYYRIQGAVTSSFPSGHAASSSFFCFFAANMFDDYLISDSNRWLRMATWTTASIVPAVVSYLRMEAGVHFFTDVAAGYAIGASCGYFIPKWHKLKSDDLSIVPLMLENYGGFTCRINLFDHDTEVR